MQMTLSTVSGFRFLSRWFPTGAAKFVYHQMFVPVPFRFKPSDIEVLNSGEALKIHCEGFNEEHFQIATWSWPPKISVFSKPKRVLLVHGWAGAGVQLKSFISPLTAAGYHVSLIDLPAHGHSSGHKTHLPGNTRVLMQILEHFDDTHTIIAHSFGATTTCIALNWGAKLEKVVLIAPMTDVTQGLFKTLMKFGATKNIFDRVKLKAEENFNISWEKLSPVCFSHELSTPALIIHDRDDSDVDVSHAKRLQMMWPQSKLLITEGLGHFKILRNKDLIQRTLQFIND